MSKLEKLKALAAVGKVLDKQFNTTGTFQSQGGKVGQIIPSIPMGLPSIDWGVFGCGGWPRGRIVEIFGIESGGKTAIASHTVGQCQKAGGVAAFIDMEHALDPTYASKLGVDMDELMVSQPNCGEEALEIVDAIVEAQAADIVVIDSVSALVPRAELEGDFGDSHMGLQARMMSQAMRKLVGKTAKTNTTVMFINQIRDKIGLVFGDPTTTSGGKALKFAASVRIEVRRVANSKGGLIKEGDEIIGHKIHWKCVKNKVGPPFKEGDTTLMYETGFDMRDDAIEHALTIKLLTGTAWLTYASDSKGEKFRREDLDWVRITEEIAKYYENLRLEAIEANAKTE